MESIELHPLASRIAEDAGLALREIDSQLLVISRFGEKAERLSLDQGLYSSRRISRGRDVEIQLLTATRDLFDRFTLISFGWRYRERAELARIYGPIKTPALPDGIRVEPQDLLLQTLVWEEAQGERMTATVARLFTHYLGLSLPFSLEELDAAVRHPTGAPIFVPQPPYDASRLPSRSSSTERDERPRRPWFRKSSNR